MLGAATTFTNTPDCTLASATPGKGTVQDDRSLCTNTRQVGINPVDTGNARFNSLFTLSDRLTFTLDGGYSYTMANGGGSTVFAESDANAGARGVSRNQIGRIGAGIAAGRDLNGDGDMLDYVRVFYPSNTQTHRLIAIAGLRYDIDPPTCCGSPIPGIAHGPRRRARRRIWASTAIRPPISADATGRSRCAMRRATC